MNNADRQVLRAIQNGPSSAAEKALARTVEGLLDDQRIDAVMEQQALLTAKLHKLADIFASIAYETAERKPVDSKDWLDPNRATGDSTDSTDAKVFGADKALGGSVACTYGCFGGNNDFDCPVHGGMQGGGRDV